MKLFSYRKCISVLAIAVAFLGSTLLTFEAMSGDKDQLKLGFIPHNKLKWTKQVPGYEPFVNFDVTWPSGALVGGHADQKTPFIIDVAVSTTLNATGLGAIKYVNWARGLAVKANSWKQMTPLGICRVTSGHYKGEWGQLDPRTGFAGISNPTCYLPFNDKREFGVVSTTKFDVLVVSPVLAQWIPNNVYNKNSRTLDAINIKSSVKGRRICRVPFKDIFKKKNDAITKQVNNLANAWNSLRYDEYRVNKLEFAKFELLPGIEINKKCRALYKSPATGDRFIFSADKYEVLLVQRDYVGKKRGTPLAIKHRQSGLCLGMKNNNAVLTHCQNNSITTRPPLLFTKNGHLRVAHFNKHKGKIYSPGKCVAADSKTHRINLQKCQKGNLFHNWYINSQHHLNSGWGVCLRVAAKPPKPGSPVIQIKNCTQKLGKEAQWGVVPLEWIEVKQDNRTLPLWVSMAGNKKKKCIKSWGGCVAAYWPGSKLTVKVFKNKKAKFTRWTSGPCKNKTNPECTFKISKNTPALKFQTKTTISDIEMMKELGWLLKVKTNGKCIDNTGSKKRGVQVHSWTCNSRNRNQRFELINRGKKTDKPLKFVQIRNKRTGMCLDVSGGSKKNGAKVVQWPCKKTKSYNQMWRILKMDNKNWFNLQALHSSKCLDLAGGKKHNGAKFIQYKCSTKNPNQRFRVDG